MKYIENRWEGLKLFLDDPRVPITSNAVERSLRGPVLGRNNHFGSRSRRGTESAALLYSLIESVVAPCELDDPSCEAEAEGEPPRRILVDRWVGESSEGKKGLLVSPVFQHTAPDRGRVRRCDACHPKGDGSNLTRVREVYGFGSGDLLWTDPRTDQTLDLALFIDETGTASVAIGTLLARALTIERIERALNVIAP